MANKDILEYLRETPHNTNVNVVKGMIGNQSDKLIVQLRHRILEEEMGFQFWIVDKTWQEIYDAMPNVIIECDGLNFEGEYEMAPFKTSLILANGPNQYGGYELTVQYNSGSYFYLQVENANGYPRSM